MQKEEVKNPELSLKGLENKLNKQNSEETLYFHQFFNDKEKKKFPSSMILVQDQNDEILALVKTKDSKGNDKHSFKKLDQALAQDSGHSIEIVNNKDMISSMIHNFKAGENQTNLVLNKVYVALERPIEKVKEWIKATNEVEKEKNKFSEKEIPYSALEKIGISKKDLTEKNIQNLLEGNNTDLLKITLKNKDLELKELPPYNIRLEREAEKVVARFTFQKDNLDISKDKIGKDLTKDEQLKILKEGEITRNIGSSSVIEREPFRIVWDKETNVLEKKKIEISTPEIKQIEITHDVKFDDKEIKALKKGQSISKDGLMNPETGMRENAKMEVKKNRIEIPKFEMELTKSKEKEKNFKER